jgi:hypothetical protein
VGTGGVLAQAAANKSTRPGTAKRRRRREALVKREFMEILY